VGERERESERDDDDDWAFGRMRRGREEARRGRLAEHHNSLFNGMFEKGVRRAARFLIGRRDGEYPDWSES
jgi:hypothetical protein